MANVNNSSASKPFEWLSGGLFFGEKNKGDGDERIDSENDVVSLLNGIHEDLKQLLSASSSDDQPSSKSLAVRLAQLRFLLYDERRITTQQAENPNLLASPSVALDTVEAIAATTDENALRTLIPELIDNLQFLQFESRKHVAAIFNYLLVCGFEGIDKEIYIPVMKKFRDYIVLNLKLLCRQLSMVMTFLLHLLPAPQPILHCTVVRCIDRVSDTRDFTGSWLSQRDELSNSSCHS